MLVAALNPGDKLRHAGTEFVVDSVDSLRVFIRVVDSNRAKSFYHAEFEQVGFEKIEPPPKRKF
jgi:hypothetical protein